MQKLKETLKEEAATSEEMLVALERASSIFKLASGMKNLMNAQDGQS